MISGSSPGLMGSGRTELVRALYAAGIRVPPGRTGTT